MSGHHGSRHETLRSGFRLDCASRVHSAQGYRRVTVRAAAYSKTLGPESKPADKHKQFWLCPIIVLNTNDGTDTARTKAWGARACADRG